jgi:hypothetical protein
LITHKYALKIQALSAELEQQEQKSQSVISILSAKVKELEDELERKLDEILQLASAPKDKETSGNVQLHPSPSHALNGDSQQVFVFPISLPLLPLPSDYNINLIFLQILLLKTLVGAKEDRLKAEELLRPDPAAQRRQVRNYFIFLNF